MRLRGNYLETVLAAEAEPTKAEIPLGAVPLQLTGLVQAWLALHPCGIHSTWSLFNLGWFEPWKKCCKPFVVFKSFAKFICCFSRITIGEFKPVVKRIEISISVTVLNKKVLTPRFEALFGM